MRAPNFPLSMAQAAWRLVVTASTCWDADGCKVGDGMLCCRRLVLNESVVLGVDPEKLMVRDGNEGAEGRGGEGKGNGVASGGGTGNVRGAEAKR